jgi:hypothetical protein
LALLVWISYYRMAFSRRLACVLATLLLAVALLPACGFAPEGGGGADPSKPGTAVGTYTLTITAASRQVSHSATLNLSVKK